MEQDTESDGQYTETLLLHTAVTELPEESVATTVAVFAPAVKYVIGSDDKNPESPPVPDQLYV